VGVRGADTFTWLLTDKKEILKLVRDYFSNYPPRSAENRQLYLMPRYFELHERGAHLAARESDLGWLWAQFLVAWSCLEVKEK
jgi:hypothetical protein